MKCCMKFRDIFIHETTVDPFEHTITIASACNLVFRKLFLKPNTIGIIPYNGYRSKDIQSVIAIKWLMWISKQNNIRIQHKFNGGEKKIGPFIVDGMDDNNTVYEFYGCYWHGCEKCFPRRNRLTADGFTTATEALQKTRERKKYIEDRNYVVVSKWECELKQELRQNQDMQRHFNETSIPEPINPRDGINVFFILHIKFMIICF